MQLKYLFLLVRAIQELHTHSKYFELHTCNELTARSSSDTYCIFLTLDRCADCLLAKILVRTTNVKAN